MRMSFPPHNAKCIWSLPDVVPIKRGMRSTLKSKKTLQDWLENSACNWDGASGQFCIEHITCPANLTKFSLKMHFPSLLPDCALSWALWFNWLCSYLSTFIVLLFEHFSVFNFQCSIHFLSSISIWLCSYLSTLFVLLFEHFAIRLKESFQQPGPIWVLGKAASD